MASPVDSARNTTSITSATTSHAINVGSPIANTLLIVWVRFHANPGSVGFSGYTTLQTLNSSDTSLNHTICFYRRATGAEGATDTLTTGNSVKSCAICWEITGAEDPATQAPEKSTIATNGTTANTCNPGSVTPTGGSDTYLFLALGGMDGESNFTGAPSGYSNLALAGTGTGDGPETNARIAGASKQATASSENPGVFTHPSANAGWSALTVAVHPGAQEVFGEVVSPFTFGRVTTGKVGAKSSVVSPLTLDLFVTGSVPGQHFGAVSSAFTFESEVNSTRVIRGQVNSPFTFGVTTIGLAPPGEFTGDPAESDGQTLTAASSDGLTLTPASDDTLTLDPRED